MKAPFWSSMLLLLVCLPLQAQPVVAPGGVLNTASSQANPVLRAW